MYLFCVFASFVVYVASHAAINNRVYCESMFKAERFAMEWRLVWHVFVIANDRHLLAQEMATLKRCPPQKIQKQLDDTNQIGTNEREK
jgi:hypothetical protein